MKLFCSKDNIESWIGAILLFLLSYPRWTWNYDLSFLSIFLQLVLLIILLKHIRIKKESCIIISFLFQIAFLLTYSSILTANVFGVMFAGINVIGFIPLFFCKRECWKSITDKLIVLYGVLLIPSIIEHCMITIGIPLPNANIGESPANPGRDYIGYFFNVYIQNHFDGEGINRFMAFYDEPGVLGNIMMVLLYLQKFDFKKWYNIVFLAAGLLSFSLVFYIAVIVYYLFYGRVRTKIAFSVFSAIIVALLYSNQEIYEILFQRFEIVDGSLAGYNRENLDFDLWIKNIPIKDYLFLGLGKSKTVYAASWKWAFALWGVIPCLLYLSTMVLSGAKLLKVNKDVFLYLILVVMIFIQRPFIYNYFYVYLFLIFQYYVSEDSKAIIQTKLFYQRTN